MSPPPHVLGSPSLSDGVVAFAVSFDNATVNVTYDGTEVCAPIDGAWGEAAVHSVRAYIAQHAAEIAALLRSVTTPAPAHQAFARTCEDVEPRLT